MRRRRAVVAGVAIGLLLAVGGGVAFALTRPDDRPSPSRAAADRPCGRPYVELLAAPPEPGKDGPVARLLGVVEEPAALAFRPGSEDGLLASRPGELRRIVSGRVLGEPVLDLRADTADEGDGGMLAVAYDPEEPWVYVYRTTRDQHEELTAYPVDDDGVPDPDGEVLVLTADHGPSEQHHGGAMGFGPDGRLYLGLGDGGGLGDPGEHGQDPGTVLGKILRITPTPWDEATPYAVPADNPFAGREGWRPEIWALGVRNPFRLTFDPATGDLWVADVGQSCWEELNRLPAGVGGLNLGWDVREGNQEFEGGALTGGESLEPEHQYPHRAGWCAIVLGFVRPDGGVLHTDYCRGRLMVLQPAAAGRAPRLTDTGIRVERSVSVVPGPDGAAWILSLDGGVYRVG